MNENIEKLDAAHKRTARPRGDLCDAIYAIREELVRLDAELLSVRQELRLVHTDDDGVLRKSLLDRVAALETEVKLLPQ